MTTRPHKGDPRKATIKYRCPKCDYEYAAYQQKGFEFVLCMRCYYMTTQKERDEYMSWANEQINFHERSISRLEEKVDKLKALLVAVIEGTNEDARRLLSEYMEDPLSW